MDKLKGTITLKTSMYGSISNATLKGDKGDTGEKGDTGADGSAATINIGTVTTLDSDENATATNSGTENKMVLNLGIPRGKNGYGNWRLVEDIITTQEVYSILQTSDSAGNAFELDDVYVLAKIPMVSTARTSSSVYLRYSSTVKSTSTAQYLHDYSHNILNVIQTSGTFGHWIFSRIKNNDGLIVNIDGSYEGDYSGVSDSTHNMKSIYTASWPYTAIGDGKIRTIAMYCGNISDTFPIGTEIKIFGREKQ